MKRDGRSVWKEIRDAIMTGGAVLGYVSETYWRTLLVVVSMSFLGSQGFVFENGDLLIFSVTSIFWILYPSITTFRTYLRNKEVKDFVDRTLIKRT